MQTLRGEEIMRGNQVFRKRLCGGAGAPRGGSAADDHDARGGALWTTDERPGDHWLRPGKTISLATGERAWVSAVSDRAARVLARLLDDG
jgi:hypothetical protein